MADPSACTFNPDQRCLKGAGCAAHGIGCMRRDAALSFTMGTMPDRTPGRPDVAEIERLCAAGRFHELNVHARLQIFEREEQTP